MRIPMKLVMLHDDEKVVSKKMMYIDPRGQMEYLPHVVALNYKQTLYYAKQQGWASNGLSYSEMAKPEWMWLSIDAFPVGLHFKTVILYGTYIEHPKFYQFWQQLKACMDPWPMSIIIRAS